MMVVYISVDLMNSSVFHHTPDTWPAKNVACLKRKLQGEVNYIYIYIYIYIYKLNSVALVRTRTIPTERPPPVGEVSANFCG